MFLHHRVNSMKNIKELIKNKKFTRIFLLVVVVVIATTILFKNRTVIKRTFKQDTGEVSTGAIPTSPEPKTQADELIDILITISPVEESYFSLKFDYKNNRFSVTLNPANNDSYNNFVTWKNDHGFEEIPLTEFHFENYSFE